MSFHLGTHAAPHLMQMERADRVLKKPWKAWKPNPYGRHIREFVRLRQRRGRGSGRIYILPPWEVAGRWYSEVRTGRAMSMSWRSYEAPAAIVSEPTREQLVRRLVRRISGLADEGLDGYALRSSFYISSLYFQLRPDAVLEGLVRDGPARVNCVSDRVLHDDTLERELDVGLGFVFARRLKFLRFPRSCEVASVRETVVGAWERYSGIARDETGNLGPAAAWADFIAWWDQKVIRATEHELRCLFQTIFYMFESLELTVGGLKDRHWNIRIRPKSPTGHPATNSVRDLAMKMLADRSPRSRYPLI